VPPAPPTPEDTPPPETAERLLAWVLLVLALVVGAALRVWQALADDGLYWPDEIYQSLEPAHRLVFGYGLVAWEFIAGARTWALPALVAALMGLARALGLDSPPGYLGFVKAAFGVMGTASAWGSYRLARAYGATPLAAAMGGALLSLASMPLYFAPRAMSENASALPVVFGLALALKPDASRRALIVAASLLGLAVLLRLQIAVFCVGLLGVLAARRRWREARLVLGVLGVWAVFYGLLDWLTWGQWFQSAIVYLDFNVRQQGGNLWGTAPFSYYGRVLYHGMPGVTVTVAVLGVLALRRAPSLALLVGAFFLLHAIQPHKELRFLVPLFPLVAALAGVGMGVVLGEVQALRLRGALASVVLAVGMGSALRAGHLTFGDLGQYEDIKPKTSAYDDSGPINRLLILAGQREDVCGLKLEHVHLAWTGGYSYFHRRVPLYPHFGPGRDSGRFNYVITHSGQGFGGQVVAEEAGNVLLRLPAGGCVPDPDYSWRLP
jgi:phosphatidylinositol glycan class B